MEEKNIAEKIESDMDDSLEARLQTLENKVNHITEQQSSLVHGLREQKQELKELNETMKELEEKLESTDKKAEITDSKVSGINKSLDIVEDKLNETRSKINTTTDKMQKRIQTIEDNLGLDSDQIAKSINPNASELEQLSSVPEGQRDDEFNVRVLRALILYENFDDISEVVKGGGERVVSKDIKTLLNGHSNSSIRYTQVQRVIDTFIEKTDDQYIERQTSEGRGIIRKPPEE